MQMVAARIFGCTDIDYVETFCVFCLLHTSGCSGQRLSRLQALADDHMHFARHVRHLGSTVACLSPSCSCAKTQPDFAVYISAT